MIKKKRRSCVQGLEITLEIRAEELFFKGIFMFTNMNQHKLQLFLYFDQIF